MPAIPEDSIDGPIMVTVDRHIICVPADVLFERALSEPARMVAALWYLLEDRPTFADIEKYLGYDAATADRLSQELERWEAEQDERENS